MSLPSQRPNYVLIWIGIVMLTFSMAGNWFLGSPSASPASLVDSARLSMDYEDSALLPAMDPSPETQAFEVPLVAENVFDQQIPVRKDEDFFKEQALANHEMVLGPQTWDANLLSGGKDQTGMELSINKVPIPLKGILPGNEGSVSKDEQWQSFRKHETPSAIPRTRKQKATDAWDQGQYNSSRGNHSGLAHRGKKSTGKNREILVQSRFRPVPNGRIAASFFLARATTQGRMEYLQGELDSDLSLKAEQYLDALEAVITEAQDDPADVEAQGHKRQELARIMQMKAKLQEHLQQRPGGIELVAELSPKQLEALMQKLSAQNPRFRALLKS